MLKAQTVSTTKISSF